MRTRCPVLVASALAAVMALAAVTVPAFALDPYDAPAISCVSSFESEITIKICAGLSGAPAGLTIQWTKVPCGMTALQIANFVWPESDDPDLCKLSLSGQPSYQHPGASRWELGSGECVDEFKVGDINFDETGVSGQNCGTEPLDCDACYIFRSFAHAGRGMSRSAWSANVVCNTLPCDVSGCTFTQGRWKAKPGQEWPALVDCGGGKMKLGTTICYTEAQLRCIFEKSGPGLIALAHQLIAAKLNVLNGATCDAVATAIAAADALIGGRTVPSDPAGCTGGTDTLPSSAVGDLITTLNNFNQGAGALMGCPAHCLAPNLIQAPARSEKAPWGKVKTRYR